MAPVFVQFLIVVGAFAYARIPPAQLSVPATESDGRGPLLVQLVNVLWLFLLYATMPDAKGPTTCLLCCVVEGAAEISDIFVMTR